MMAAQNFAPKLYHYYIISGTFVCDVNAKCINTIGSYRCECVYGYEGNGKQCVDRCSVKDPPCPESSKCVITANDTLACSCNSGRIWNETSQACERGGSTVQVGFIFLVPWSTGNTPVPLASWSPEPLIFWSLVPGLSFLSRIARIIISYAFQKHNNIPELFTFLTRVGNIPQ